MKHGVPHACLFFMFLEPLVDFIAALEDAEHTNQDIYITCIDLKMHLILFTVYASCN